MHEADNGAIEIERSFVRVKIVFPVIKKWDPFILIFKTLLKIVINTNPSPKVPVMNHTDRNWTCWILHPKSISYDVTMTLVTFRYQTFISAKRFIRILGTKMDFLFPLCIPKSKTLVFDWWDINWWNPASMPARCNIEFVFTPYIYELCVIHVSIRNPLVFWSLDSPICWYNVGIKLSTWSLV